MRKTAFFITAVFTLASCVASLAQGAGFSRENRLSLPDRGGATKVREADFPAVTVSLDLRDMDIVEALKFIAGKANINIISTKDVSGRITLTVTDVLIKDIFDIILRSNNLAYEKRENIFLVMSEVEYKNRFGRNSSDSRVTRIFHLQYAIPEQALNLLNTLKSDIGKVLLDQDSGVVLAMDIPEKIAAMEEALAAMDRKNEIRVINLKYARAKDIEEQLKLQLDVKKVGSIKADERTNQVIVQTLPERMENIARLIEGLDTKTKQILIDAKIIQVKITDELSAGVRWEGLFDVGREHGVSYVGSTPVSSVLGPNDDWKSRQQALIDTGYIGSYPFSGTSVDNYAAGKPKFMTDELHFGVVGKHDIDFILKYLKTLGSTKVLSNPKLAVVNNQEAKIHVGEKQAYITTTTTQTDSGTTVSEAVTFVDVGIQLFVTPTINEDGFVTVKIKPEISSILSFLSTSSNNKIPIIDTSTAETIVMVKDGSSIMIGGLSKEEKSSDDTSVPFLGKLPIVGNLFSSKNSKAGRSELVILLTPHIIEGDELVTASARDFADVLNNKYQKYAPVSEEAAAIELKNYQSYPVRSEGDVMPGLKPAQNF